MSKSRNRTHLQVLLQESWRTEQGRADVGTALKGLGLTVTGVGIATISARASADTFEAVFGQAPDVPGHPGDGFTERELKVPAPLTRSVVAITIAPRHETIGDRPDAREPSDSE